MNARRSARVLAFTLAALNTSSCAATRHGDPWWSVDKAMHASMSASIAMGTMGASTGTIEPLGARAGLAAGATLGLGAGKELLDFAGLGTPSWRDFAWDAFGTALGVGLAVALDVLLRSQPPAGP